MTPPEPRSSQVEPPSARSPPSSPVLCALSLSSVTFPAHPKPELPADKSFHAGRHNHPTEPHVNFPLPFWFTYFFSAKTNTNKREPTDSKWVCVTIPASPSWSLWPSHDSPQKATFPLGHPEMLHSAENQDERAGMGRYFYPFQKKKKRAKERRGGVCTQKDRKVQGRFWAEKGEVAVLTCLRPGEDSAGVECLPLRCCQLLMTRCSAPPAPADSPLSVSLCD